MDSVTQFALGACVGAATLGPRIGMRKAALIGGLMGTVPDLDTFIPSADPVQSFTAHRGASHSLIIQALATPLFHWRWYRLKTRLVCWQIWMPMPARSMTTCVR